MLKVDQVYKSFKGVDVLKGVSFETTENSILGLAGPSGSGKTTLLRSIEELEKIDSGKITVNGDTSFVFQDFQLFPHMTVMKNLIYSPSLKKKETHEQLVEKARGILKNLGIPDKENAFPSQLSGGQKQRVALGRSLMMHPSLLLCDEPTSGLDVATITEVVSLLESVHNMGVSMVIASHDLDFLTRVAHRILLLKDGKIVMDMNPKQEEHPISVLKKFYQP